MTAEGLAAVLDGSGIYSGDVNERLWLSIPPAMRLVDFTLSSVPEEFAGAFAKPKAGQFRVNLERLPVEMQRELAWCLWRIVDLGGRIHQSQFLPLVARVGDVVDDLDRRRRSLMDLPLAGWEREVRTSVLRRRGQLPGVVYMRNFMTQFGRCYRMLCATYDPRPWWQHEIWNPVWDQRIPRREHEPSGRHSLYFHTIERDWLRRGAQWWFKIGLETSTRSWSTLRANLTGLRSFDRFLVETGVDIPWLCDDPAGVRPLMLDYLGFLRGLRTKAHERDRPMTDGRVNDVMTDVERFYAFMHDNREAAARALDEDGWNRLGAQHLRFYRHSEKPRKVNRADQQWVIDETAFSELMSHVHVVGEPLVDGGQGDSQAMRAVMLLARTGRRINEIMLLDYDPLVALDGPSRPDQDRDGFVAKLRYQQTKIDGAPNTMFVDAEVVAIVRAQQHWVGEFCAARSITARPKYLFIAMTMNRNADRPYTAERVRWHLSELAARFDIRDDQGRPVDFNRTHRFRHTRATSLLNAGVPLHVVQRDLGHLSPTMTMVYAETLERTHEQEFLRWRKVTADGRDLDVDPRDLYDILELERRSDRVLPNGWCLLPPRQVCAKGNACLTCDKFATDATYLPELVDQLAKTERLVDDRRQAFLARTGQEMGDDNVWLAGRRQEQRALGRIIVTLRQRPDAQAVRRAGVTARDNSEESADAARKP